MYNRYLTSAGSDTPPVHNSFQPLRAEQPSTAPPHGKRTEHAPPHAAAFSDLTRALTGRLQNIKLDMDTILALGIVWFLLSDSEETDWEQFLMIGALLILGI